MAYFAELDDNNIVKRVISVNNNELLENGIEKENKGIDFLQSLFGHRNWKQTSYNGNIRKNYAGPDYIYDQNRDAFIPPQPYSSWVLNESTCNWESPVPYPTDGKIYIWDESITSWSEFN